MASQHTFQDVTPEILDHLANQPGEADSLSLTFHETGLSGEAKGMSSLGEVSVGFEYRPESAELTLTVLKKPILVPVPLLWAEFSQALRRARAEMASRSA